MSRTLVNVAGRWMLERELESDRAAEGFTEVDDATGLDVWSRQQRNPRGARIAIGAQLARAAGATAVPAIVVEQNVESGGAEQRGMHHAVADVACVAVAEQHVSARRTEACGHPPPVQPLAVLGFDRHVFGGDPCPRRSRQDLACRKEQQRVEEERQHAAVRSFRVANPVSPTNFRLYAAKRSWPVHRA
jgi:hypothetical protein